MPSPHPSAHTFLPLPPTTPITLLPSPPPHAHHPSSNTIHLFYPVSYPPHCHLPPISFPLVYMLCCYFLIQHPFVLFSPLAFVVCSTQLLIIPSRIHLSLSRFCLTLKMKLKYILESNKGRHSKGVGASRANVTNP